MIQIVCNSQYACTVRKTIHWMRRRRDMKDSLGELVGRRFSDDDFNWIKRQLLPDYLKYDWTVKRKENRKWVRLKVQPLTPVWICLGERVTNINALFIFNFFTQSWRFDLNSNLVKKKKKRIFFPPLNKPTYVNMCSCVNSVWWHYTDWH